MDCKERLRIINTIILISGIILNIYNAVVIPKNGFAKIIENEYEKATRNN